MKKRLDEKLLVSDFTFGFELEAYVNEHYIHVNKELLQKILDVAKYKPQDFEIPYEEIAQIHVYSQLDYGYVLDTYEDLTEDESLRRELYSNKEIFPEANRLLQAEKYFPEAKWVKMKSKGITSDGSLGDCGFEWRSPVMAITPESIAHTIAFLKHCKNNGIYVDESCGFHTHIAFNGITEDDAKWIVMKLALDEEEVDKILELQLYTDKEDKHEPISFRSQWSKTRYLSDLRKYLNKLSTETESDKINNLIEKINGLLTDDKYRALRIHPQGTLEWRSPREFLDYDDKYIKSFFLSLYDFVNWMRKVLDEKEIGNYTRDNLMKLLDSSTSVSHPFVNDSGFKKLMDRIDKNPYALLKLGDIPLTKLDRFFNVAIRNRNQLLAYTNIVNHIAMEGKKIPNNVLACSIVHMNVKDAGKLIEKLTQPLPIKEIENLNLIHYGKKSLNHIIPNITSLAKDDIKTMVSETTLTYTDIINGWRYGVEHELNPSNKKLIYNLLANKFNISSEQVKNDFKNLY